MPRVAEGRDRVADPGPGPPGSQPRSIRSAPSAGEPLGLAEQIASRDEPRGVVDLGEDLDVERAVALEPRVGLAEEAGQVAQVLGAELDGDAPPSRRPARGRPGSGRAGSRGRSPAGPRGGGATHFGGHQGGHRDRQDGHLGREPRLRRQLVEHLPERELGQAAGDEQDAAGSRAVRSGSPWPVLRGEEGWGRRPSGTVPPLILSRPAIHCPAAAGGLTTTYCLSLYMM